MSVDSPALPSDDNQQPKLKNTESEQERTNASVAGATGILALGNIFSRVLGLAREIVLTFLFGATGAVVREWLLDRQALGFPTAGTRHG